jgi:hypothetical protein
MKTEATTRDLNDLGPLVDKDLLAEMIRALRLSLITTGSICVSTCIRRIDAM